MDPQNRQPSKDETEVLDWIKEQKERLSRGSPTVHSETKQPDSQKKGNNMKVLRTIWTEARLFLVAGLLGTIVAYLLGTFGFLDTTTPAYGKLRYTYTSFDDGKLLAAILFPYLLVLSYRLVRVMIRLLKTNR